MTVMTQFLGLPIVMMPKKYHEKGAETPTKLGTQLRCRDLVAEAQSGPASWRRWDKMGVAGCLPVTDALSCDNGARI